MSDTTVPEEAPAGRKRTVDPEDTTQRAIRRAVQSILHRAASAHRAIELDTRLTPVEIQLAIGEAERFSRAMEQRRQPQLGEEHPPLLPLAPVRRHRRRGET